MRIFMSYRREDSANVSGRIYDRLVEHFGDEAIFKDVDDIPFGVNFKTHLNNIVEQSAVELVIIGPNWLNAADEHGDRRLDDPTDWVRIEIEAALKRDIPVIPLLVSGARMPPAERLPDDITELAYRNGTPVRPDPDFHTDMNRLVKGLEDYVTPQAEPAKAAATSRSKATVPESKRADRPSLLAYFFLHWPRWRVWFMVLGLIAAVVVGILSRWSGSVDPFLFILLLSFLTTGLLIFLPLGITLSGLYIVLAQLKKRSGL